MFQVVHQQFRMNDDAVLHAAALFKPGTEGVAFPVGKVLFPKERIAEGQSGGDAILLHQGKDFFCVVLPEACPSSAPDAVRRGAVDGAYLAPVVKIFPMLPEERQEHTVQLIELEQPRQVIISPSAFRLFHRLISPQPGTSATVTSLTFVPVAPVMISPSTVFRAW